MIVVLHATQTDGSSFFQKKEMREIGMTKCVVYLELSSLQALGKLKSEHLLLIPIKDMLHKTKVGRPEGNVFTWVAGYVGILGNEAADRALQKGTYR